MAFIESEARKDVKGFADLLDYFALVAPGVVLTSTGLYVAGWEFIGPDMDGLAVDECWQIANRMAKKLRLGAGWTVQCDLIRNERPEYCQECDWPDAVSYLIDCERRFRFTADGLAAVRLSRYFLTLSFEPVLRGGRKAARWMFASDNTAQEGPGERALELFNSKLADFDSLLRSNMRDVRRLGADSQRVGEVQQPCDEFLRFIRQCVTGEDYPFIVPETPAHLNQYLATDDFTGGAEPQLGDPESGIAPGKRIAVIAIDGFPEKSFAGILRELDSLPFNFRYCQQGQLLGEEEAKEKYKEAKGKWGFKKTPAKEKISPIKVAASGTVDGFAVDMERDAMQAMAAAEYGKEVFARFSAKIVVMETEREALKASVDAAMRALKYRCGFSCRLETVNAVAAWLATFPGQHHREPRTLMPNTVNMVHMMPLSAPFRGHEVNPCSYFPPNSPPLFYGLTSGGSAYRFNSYVKDVGHTLVVGPTGSGKTTLLALSIAQFFRYPDAQVFAFDKKRTLYTLCKAMGGHFYDISPDNQGLKLCPLQDLETPRDREWATQWVELLLSQNDLKITHSTRNQIKEAIDLLAGDNHTQRSLTAFQMAVPSTSVKEALEFYVGGILDGDHDAISMSRFCVFEMDELYRLDKKTMNGALFYIFAKIRRRLTSSIPTLVTVDEFREALEHPMAAKAFDEFLFEGRKLNMAVWLVVQDLSKVMASALKSTVLEQCFTKICLPNTQAISEGAEAYEALGLNARDREMIAYAESKSDYYVTSPESKRMIALELQGVALAFLAHSNDADRALVDELIAREGTRWPGEWLRRHGFSDWAEEYWNLTTAKETAAYA